MSNYLQKYKAQLADVKKHLLFTGQSLTKTMSPNEIKNQKIVKYSNNRIFVNFKEMKSTRKQFPKYYERINLVNL